MKYEYQNLPIIENDRVRLRKIESTDTGNIIKWRNSDEVKNSFIFRDELTEDIHNKWLENKVYTLNVIQYIIEIKNSEDYTPVGTVYIRDIDYINSSGEFGIFLGEKDSRGIGIGSLTTKMFLNFAHKEFGLHRIFLRLLSENIIAYKTYINCNFNFEGVFRDMIKINEKYVDVIFMSSIDNSNKQ